jgi:hypothetical protein
MARQTLLETKSKRIEVNIPILFCCWENQYESPSTQCEANNVTGAAEMWFPQHKLSNCREIIRDSTDILKQESNSTFVTKA